MLTHPDTFVVSFLSPRMARRLVRRFLFLPLIGLPLCCLLLHATPAQTQTHAAQPSAPIAPRALASSPTLVWIDTDIGDDIDDAFAVALLLRSPQVRVVGISTTFGDTDLRARLLDHFLAAAHVIDIPVYTGLPTSTTNLFTQRAYAEHFPPRSHPDAVTALLAAVHQYGNRLTLLAIGPLFNVAAAIDRDPATMRQLGRIVLMGGSIRQGYLTADARITPPTAEWNILQDPPGAKVVFASGIPIRLFPLDSTQISLHRADRQQLFTAHAPFSAPLQSLYSEWRPHAWNHSSSPVLFDAVAASSILEPQLCPTRPMRLDITAEGLTKIVPGPPNARVCLRSQPSAFLTLLMNRLTGHLTP